MKLFLNIMYEGTKSLIVIGLIIALCIGILSGIDKFADDYPGYFCAAGLLIVIFFLGWTTTEYDRKHNKMLKEHARRLAKFNEDK